MKRAEQALDHIQLFIVVTIIAGAISFILPTEKRESVSLIGLDTIHY